jgi:peroxiredoxin 2/4
MKKLMVIAVVMTLGISMSLAQSKQNEIQKIPLLGSDAPAFRAETTTGQVNFPKDFGKNWKILFSHPRDFTPVCSSEILELAYRQDQFDKLGAKLIVVSVDRLAQHKSWKAALEEVNYKGREKVKIKFPLAEDHTYSIANSYGMLDNQNNVGQSIRGVFFINPENKISAFYFYPNEVGRNVDEIIRTLKALQVNYANNRLIVPANWTPGEDVMIAHLTDDDKKEMLKENSGIYSLSWFMNYMRLK